MKIHFYKNIVDNQTLFNAVCKHLAKQKRRAAKTSTNRMSDFCMYYNPAEDTRCAIGGVVLMQDAKRMEQNHSCKTATSTEFEYPEWMNSSLLAAMQQCHDSKMNSDAEALKYALRSEARHFGLDDRAVNLITEWSL